MKYEIEHSVSMRFSGLPERRPETAQLWIPTPKDVIAKFSFNPTSSTFTQDVGCTINFWGEIPLKNTVITCFYEHPGTPRIPPTTERFISKALARNDALTYITTELLDIPLIKDIESLVVPEQIQAIKSYLVKKLKYEYPPQTREAGEVLEINKSDCGGYHSAFVALCRSLKIPAVLDFGFRTKNDNYHTWAWWFDKITNTWTMEDLNDEQNHTSKEGRVSMTLSTAPDLIPPYPKPILYLQSHLAWINNIDALKAKGLVFNHSSKWNVKQLA